MSGLYRAESVRELDRIAIEELGIPGIELMERAGAAAFAALRERWPEARVIAVCCGAGNNAGDGFVVARLAREAGLEPRVLAVGGGGEPRGDAALAAARMREAGLAAEPFAPERLAGAAVIVDAVFGTGLARPVSGAWAEALAAIEAATAPVLAIDIPSGLSADSGAVLGRAVRAECTVSFIARKQGLYTGAGPEHAGERRFDDLGVPAELYARRPPDAVLLDLDAFCGVLGRRARDAHKGSCGHVLVIGGERGFAGAARLAAEAAARAGAGLVSVATRAEHLAVISATRPELMCHAVAGPAELAVLLERATVVALGPGLGQGEWGRALAAAALATALPAVVDADALNLLAGGALGAPAPAARVYTPHPGEAARLLGTSSAAVQADRFAALTALVERHGGVWLLKGAGTLIGGEEALPAVCPYGNPGMASGGMGDALTGIVAGLLAQGLGPRAAAEAGACVHGRSADLAAAGGERGLLAGDLIEQVRALVDRL